MADTLAIQRFVVTGIGAAGGGAADRMNATIAKVDKRRLSARLERQCAGILSGATGVVQIRKLHVDVDQASASDADAIADQLARAIAMAIARAVRVGSSDNIVVHASASARLASFIVSLSAGTAWSGWWFDNLKALRVLPVSAAIRTVLLQDSAQCCAILAAISVDELEFVLGSLSDPDAAAVVHALASQCGSDGDAAQWAQVFALARPASPLAFNQLALFALAICGARPTDGHVDTSAGLGLLPPIAAVRIWAAMVKSGITNAAALLTTSDPHVLRGACPDVSVSDIGSLAQLSPADRATVADAAERAGITRAVATQHTRFGGLILLWPCLLDEMPDDLPDGPGEPHGVAALLALSSLYPDDWQPEIWGDTVLRSLFQIDAQASFADLMAYLDQNTTLLENMGTATFANFKRRLTGFADASFAFLLENMLDVSARVTIGDTAIKVVLDRPKLDVLLSISGLANKVVPVPDGRILSIERTL
jgi:hypothetical protein